MTAQQRQTQIDRVRRISAWAGAIFIDVILLIFLVLSFYVAPGTADVVLNIAILAASVVVGWLMGTLLSPGTLREQGQFGTATKAISTFISGYLLAKIDNVLNAIFAPKMLLESTSVLPAFRMAMALSGVVGMALVIYIMRVYVLEWVPASKEATDGEGAK